MENRVTSELAAAKFDRLVSAILVLALTIVMGCLVWYLTYAYHFHINTDAASKIFLAESIIRNGELFPNDWVYVNGDIWVLFLHFPLVFLLQFIDSYPLAYSINTAIHLGLLIYCAMHLARVANLNLNEKLFLFLVLFLPISFFFSDQMFGEISFSPQAIGVLFVTGMFLRSFSKNMPLSNNSIIVFFALQFLIYVHGPFKYAFFILLPILAAFLFFLINDRITLRSFVKVSLTCVFALALAFFAYSHLKSDVLMAHGAANTKIVSQFAGFNDIDTILANFLQFFGMQLGTNEPLLSIYSLYSFLVFFAFLFGAYLMFVRCRFKQLMTDEERFFYLCTLFSLCFTSFAYLFFEPLSMGVTSIRYFIPTYYFFILFVFFWVKSKSENHRLAIVSFIAVLATSGALIAQVAPNERYWSDRNTKEVVTLLQAENIEKVYATYWQVGSLKLFSNKQFETLPLQINTFAPFYWLFDKSLFKKKEGIRSALILTTAESSAFANHIRTFNLQQNVEMRNMGDINVYLLDNDLASYFYPTYEATYSEGIDFTRKGYPEFIDEVNGLSSYEPMLRWTDGQIVEFKFNENLEGSFVVSFEIIGFGTNVGEDLLVNFGSQTRSVSIPAGFKNFQVEFTGEQDSVLRFVIPKPQPVVENGVIKDPRKLGIGFKTLKFFQL